MAKTTAQEVYDCFEATFSDKVEIMESLEKQWLKMAVAKYNLEIATDTPLVFDSELNEFSTELPYEVILVLGKMIRVTYQEREYSRVNKIASVVGSDLSVNSGMSLSKHSKEELDYHSFDLSEDIEHSKPTAFD